MIRFIIHPSHLIYPLSVLYLDPLCESGLVCWVMSMVVIMYFFQ